MEGFIRDLKLVSGARRRLDRHFHEEYSLAFLHSGASRARLPGAELPVAGGDIVLLPPRLVHACNPDEGEEWSYSLFLLEPAWVELALGWGTPPQGPLRVPMAAGSGPSQARIGEARGDRSALEAIAREGLEALARSLAEPRASGRRPPPPGILAARRHIDAHLGSALALDELARVAGLSKYRFIRAFSAAYGLTPHAYLLSARVNRAKLQLAAGGGIARAACENGFCDQSHFSRTFASRVGLTPGDYVER